MKNKKYPTIVNSYKNKIEFEDETTEISFLSFDYLERDKKLNSEDKSWQEQQLILMPNN